MEEEGSNCLPILGFLRDPPREGKKIQVLFIKKSLTFLLRGEKRIHGSLWWVGLVRRPIENCWRLNKTIALKNKIHPRICIKCWNTRTQLRDTPFWTATHLKYFPPRMCFKDVAWSLDIKYNRSKGLGLTKQKIEIFSLFRYVLWVISRKPANFSTAIFFSFFFFKSVNCPQSSCQEWMPSWLPILEKAKAMYGYSCQLPASHSRVGARPAHSISTNRGWSRKSCFQLWRDEIIAKSGWPGSQVQQLRRNEAENGACAHATFPLSSRLS